MEYIVVCFSHQILFTSGLIKIFGLREGQLSYISVLISLSLV